MQILHNTLTSQKQVLTPMTPKTVNMYVCGMTVYDNCHIGHGRMLVSFDVIRRWLETQGNTVNFVRNITDIDDKIINRAVENKETMTQLTTRTIAAMHEDCAALNVLPPTHEPRATAYVPQMLGIIDTLAQKNLAYLAGDGDVNFAVRGFANYGRLSGKTLDTLDDMNAGERVAVNTHKRDPLDFVLWKAAKASDPAEATWQSQWGAGRPGWHIECSAMSCALLGETFDIHGGGPDLKFPHHENEIAQSEGATGKTLAHVWMHCGPLNVDNTKMSKSLGNFFYIRDLLKKYDAEVLRFLLIRSHYRSIMNYTESALSEAKTALSRLYVALRDSNDTGDSTKTNTSLATPLVASLVTSLTTANSITPDFTSPYGARFAAAMYDDFNTPEAFAVLFEMANELNRTRSPALAAEMKSLAGVLGLLYQDPATFLQNAVKVDESKAGGLDNAAIEALIAARASAKVEKDFAGADAIRKQLIEAGIVLEDKAGQTLWRRT